MDLWQFHGECANHDPELWFPVSNAREASAPAKAICLTCPVTGECLAYAIDHNISDGVWGGLTGIEREILAARPKPPPWRIPADQVDHGSEAACRWHLRYDRPACADCIRGERERGRAKREARREEMAS